MYGKKFAHIYTACVLDGKKHFRKGDLKITKSTHYCPVSVGPQTTLLLGLRLQKILLLL